MGLSILPGDLIHSCYDSASTENGKRLKMAEEIVPKISAETVIQRVSCPSLERFRTQWFETDTPVILTDCIDHWPAKSMWNLDYFNVS